LLSVHHEKYYTTADFPSKFLMRQGGHSGLETVKDFLIKLGIKPLMYLLEIRIFSFNNDLVRLTKIMNNLVKDFKILSFKVIFQRLKLVESFQKKICKLYLIRRPTYIYEMLGKLWFVKYFFTKNEPNFCQLCS
jgi:hypothetical protein